MSFIVVKANGHRVKGSPNFAFAFEALTYIRRDCGNSPTLKVKRLHL